LKIDYHLLEIDFSRLSFPDSKVNILGCWEVWCSCQGGWWNRPITDRTSRLHRPALHAA